MPCRTPSVSSPANDDRGESKLPAAAGEQVAQITGLREVQHCRDDDGGKRRVRHAPEQRRQQDQGQEAKERGDKIGELGAGAGGHRHRGLGQAADDEEAAEEAAQDVGGPVRDQLLVRVDVAAALHRRRLCSAERLGIADQHDGERAGREFPQDRGVKVGQGEVRQAGREVADHADAGGFAAEQADEERGRDRDDQGRGYAGRQVAEQLHGDEAEQAGQHRGERSIGQMLQHEPELREEIAGRAARCPADAAPGR